MRGLDPPCHTPPHRPARRPALPLTARRNKRPIKLLRMRSASPEGPFRSGAFVCFRNIFFANSSFGYVLQPCRIMYQQIF